MAGLASVTSRIQLFATCAVLSLPPPIAARMAVTIDSISHSRFGVNIISSWHGVNTPRWGSGQVPSTTAAATSIVLNT